MMKIGLVALATFACAVPAIATATENPFAQDQAILDLNGLNLASAEGQQRLAIRIDQVANTVCGDRMASLHLTVQAKSQACRTAVIADVRSQIEARLAMSAKPVQLADAR